LSTIDLQIFFKKEKISPTNQNIILDYLTSIKLDGRSEATIKNNTAIMMFIATRVRSDLDKITRADVKQLRLAIETWARKDGKPASDATKQQYKIGLKRFLSKYGAENGIIEMIELAKPIKSTGKAKCKLPEDLLTLDEVKQLITAANNIRDKALIAIMYESGGRIGEHVSYRVKDIMWNEYGCTLTFPKGKTGARKIQLVFAASYLRQWLEIHPLSENRDAALWVSLKGYGESSEHVKLIGRAVSEMLSRTAERAGIKKKYTHIFLGTLARRIWPRHGQRASLKIS
jgi:integrase/recombinase XerD